MHQKLMIIFVLLAFLFGCAGQEKAAEPEKVPFAKKIEQTYLIEVGDVATSSWAGNVAESLAKETDILIYFESGAGEAKHQDIKRNFIQVSVQGLLDLLKKSGFECFVDEKREMIIIRPPEKKETPGPTTRPTVPEAASAAASPKPATEARVDNLEKKMDTILGALKELAEKEKKK